MTHLLAGGLTSLCNRILTLLRNRQPHAFSREEIRFMRLSFGQYGEDLAAVHWGDLLGVDRGVYVDVGAFAPAHLSNTLLLYKAGWRGVNVDMAPERVAQFTRHRPGDYNVCGAISDVEADVTLQLYFTRSVVTHRPRSGTCGS